MLLTQNSCFKKKIEVYIIKPIFTILFGTPMQPQCIIIYIKKTAIDPRGKPEFCPLFKAHCKVLALASQADHRLLLAVVSGSQINNWLGSH